MGTTFIPQQTVITADWLNGVDDVIYDYKPNATGSASRPVQGKLEERVSVKDFGAVGNNVADDSAAIQAAINHVVANGGKLYFPRGRYYCTATLLIDYSTETGDPINGVLNRLSIEGDGAGCTQIRNPNGVPLLRFNGGVVNTDGVHSLFFVSGICLLNGFRNAGSIGIRMDNVAFWGLKDVDLFGFEYGIIGIDTLSGYWHGGRNWSHKYGFYFERVDFSAPNAISFYNVATASCRVYGGLVVGGTSFKYVGGSLEGNGIDLANGVADGDAARLSYWGIKAVGSGFEGSQGLVIDGTYVEGNEGYADIWIEQNSNTAHHSIVNSSFARIFSDRYTIYPVLYSGTNTTSRVTVSGCGFRALNTYVEAPGRPYLGATSAVFIEGGGNTYETPTSLDRSVFSPVRLPVSTKALLTSDVRQQATNPTNTGALSYVTDATVANGAALVVGTGTTWRAVGLPIHAPTNTVDVPNLTAGSSHTATFTCTGAVLGDYAFASMDIDLLGLTMTSYVSSANTVTVRWVNNTAGAVNLPSANIFIMVIPPCKP